MGRYALAATSLVAAIPAGILATVAIIGFVNYTEDMGTLMIAVNGTATAIGVLLALSPVIILVGRRRDKTADEASDPATDAAAGSGELHAQTAEIVVGDEAVDDDSAADEVAAVADDSADDLSDDEVSVADTGDFQFDAEDFADADSEEELFEFDDEEEPKA